MGSVEDGSTDRLAASCPPDACGGFTGSDVSIERDETKATGIALRVPSHGSQPSGRSSLSEAGTTLGTRSSDLAVTPNNNEKALSINSETVQDTANYSSPTDFFLNSRIDEFGFIRSPNIESRGAAVDLDTLRKREKKWLHMLTNWSYFMDNKYEKVRERCRKGIPPSLRGRAWKHLCGAAFHMEFSVNKHVFEDISCQSGDPRWIEDIKKDLNRQFPEHVMFSRIGPYGKGGKSDLFELLKAYTVLHPEEGYCQGQAPLAAVLLMHMPLRDAFYCFVQICHKYLPGYYSAGLEAIQIDGDILFQVLKDKSRLSYRHLKKHRVEPVLYMVEWFMCIFCRTLPWPTVLRVWDMFFCEGVKVLFKVAVILFRYGLGTSEQLKEFNDFHSIVTRLKNLPEKIMAEDFLIQKIIDLDLDDVELERIHYRAMKTRQLRMKAE